MFTCSLCTPGSQNNWIEQAAVFWRHSYFDVLPSLSFRRVCGTSHPASGWTSGRSSLKSIAPFNSPSSTCRCVSLCGVTLNANIFGFQVCVPVQPIATAEGTGGVWLHQQEGEPRPDQADHPHPQQGQPSAQHRPGKIFLLYLLQPHHHHIEVRPSSKPIKCPFSAHCPLVCGKHHTTIKKTDNNAKQMACMICLV